MGKNSKDRNTESKGLMEFRNQFLNPKQEALWLVKCGVSAPCSNLSRRISCEQSVVCLLTQELEWRGPQRVQQQGS